MSFGLLQHTKMDYLGGKFPLLIKIIHANDFLSVQVHPDDDMAKSLEGAGNGAKDFAAENIFALRKDERALFASQNAKLIKIT